MPQMAPMNWTLLFLFFITLYLTSLILIYFMKNVPQINSPANVNLTPSSPNNVWTW